MGRAYVLHAVHGSPVAGHQILLLQRPRDQEEESTYDELKAAAHRTGDAAKEWMSGSSTTGSSVYKAAKEDKEKLYMGTKRAVEGGLGPASETHGKDG